MENTKPPESCVKNKDNPNPNPSEPVAFPTKAPRSRRLDRFGMLVIPLLTTFFFFYDVFYVAPQQLGTLGVAVYGIVLTYIWYNILGNMWACCRKSSGVDTLPPELRTPAKGEEHLWHYCGKCQELVPPRSGHCKLCKRCILKRDHHCILTGSCVGHNNQRYFIWLNFYLSLGSGQVLISNTILALKHDVVLGDLMMVLNVFFGVIEPNFWLKYGLSMVLYLNVLSFVGPMVMFASEVSMVRKNTVMFDKANHTYDLGVRRNFDQVLGHRSFWTCLSPAIKSILPHAGTQWQSKPS